MADETTQGVHPFTVAWWRSLPGVYRQADRVQGYRLRDAWWGINRDPRFITGPDGWDQANVSDKAWESTIDFTRTFRVTPQVPVHIRSWHAPKLKLTDGTVIDATEGTRIRHIVRDHTGNIVADDAPMDGVDPWGETLDGGGVISNIDLIYDGGTVTAVVAPDTIDTGDLDAGTDLRATTHTSDTDDTGDAGDAASAGEVVRGAGESSTVSTDEGWLVHHTRVVPNRFGVLHVTVRVTVDITVLNLGDRFLVVSGSSVELTRKNPVLRVGQPGVELDTGEVKVGDGVTAWRQLGYRASGVRDVFAATHTGPFDYLAAIHVGTRDAVFSDLPTRADFLIADAYPLLRYLDGVGHQAGYLSDMVNEMHAGAWTDPVTCPESVLPFLAVVLGSPPRYTRTLTPPRLREHLLGLIAGKSPAPGSREHIALTAQQWLTGSRQVSVTPAHTLAEYTGPDPLHTLIISVRADEVPRNDLIGFARFLNDSGVVPAGHLIIPRESTQTWDAWEKAMGPDWASLEAVSPNWNRHDSAGVSLDYTEGDTP